VCVCVLFFSSRVFPLADVAPSTAKTTIDRSLLFLLLISYNFSVHFNTRRVRDVAARVR